jgi:hypothetical protein
MGDMVSSAVERRSLSTGRGASTSASRHRVQRTGVDAEAADQYDQLVRSAPAGAVLRIRSAIFGMNIW